MIAKIEDKNRRTEQIKKTKEVLLGCKRTRFAIQKDSFWGAKGPLLKGKRTPFLKSYVLSVKC